MTATRQHDEELLHALRLLKTRPMNGVARALRKDASNLTKAVRAVLRDDLNHDDPYEVIQHYPRNMIISRV